MPPKRSNSKQNLMKIPKYNTMKLKVQSFVKEEVNNDNKENEINVIAFKSEADLQNNHNDRYDSNKKKRDKSQSKDEIKENNHDEN